MCALGRQPAACEGGFGREGRGWRRRSVALGGARRGRSCVSSPGSWHRPCPAVPPTAGPAAPPHPSTAPGLARGHADSPPCPPARQTRAAAAPHAPLRWPAHSRRARPAPREHAARRSRTQMRAQAAPAPDACRGGCVCVCARAFLWVHVRGGRISGGSVTVHLSQTQRCNSAAPAWPGPADASPAAALPCRCQPCPGSCRHLTCRRGPCVRCGACTRRSASHTPHGPGARLARASGRSIRTPSRRRRPWRTLRAGRGR